MKYFVKVNGRPHEVEVVERLGELHLRVDGEELPLSYQEVDALGQAHLIADNRSYAVSIEGNGRAAGITIAGHFYSVEIEDERERAAHAAERAGGNKGGVVKSLMPGVVVRVLAVEGQAVERGEPLLILEAMKMQNEIDAPTAGTVSAVHVAEGSAVGAGQKLVTILAPAD